MDSWTPLVATHATVATIGLILGGYLLLRPTKGDAAHVLLGRVWVIAMAFVALSSFAIREIRGGELSLLHVLSVVTVVSFTWAVVAIRRGDVARHRSAMRGGWLGSLGAFIGAVAVPDRRIPTFAVSDPLGAAVASAIVLLTSIALIGMAHAWERRHPGRTRCGPVSTKTGIRTSRWTTSSGSTSTAATPPAPTRSGCANDPN